LSRPGRPMTGLERPGKGPFPLKHVLLYSWEFKAAQSLSEVAERLREAKFYVVRPRKDVLVATSLARPGAVIMVFSQKGERGGDLVLVQTPEGPYGFDHIVKAMLVFARIAGIKLTGLWPRGAGPAGP